MLYQQLLSPLEESRRSADVEALKRIGASGAIIGRALYTGDLTLPDAIAAAR